MQKSLLPKMTTFGKWGVIVLLAFILIWPLTVGIYWGVYKGFTAIDATRFPWFSSNIRSLLNQANPNSGEKKKELCSVQPSATGWRKRWARLLAGRSMI